YKVIFLYQDLLGKFNKINLSFACFSFHDKFAVTSFDLTVRYHTVNLGYYRWVGWVSGFEKFSYPRKTTGNITRFRRFSWDLDHNLTGLNLFTVVYHKVGTYRKVISALLNSFGIYFLQCWYRFLITGFRNYLLLKSGLLINFQLEGYSLNNIFVLYLAGRFCNNYRVIWIPLRNYIAFFHLIARLHQ